MTIEDDKLFMKTSKNGTETPIWSPKGHDF
jgi:hypothetical protein